MTHKASVDESLAVGRRPLLKSVGFGLAGTALLTGPVGAASARSDDLAHELNTVRAATRKYRDVELAREDGYDTEVSPYTPGMGFHFVNPTFVAPDEEGSFDLENPPILVYYTTGNYNPGPYGLHDPDRDDDLRLGGVEFAHLGDVEELAGQDPPADPGDGTPANIFSDEESSRNLKVSEEEGWEWVPGPNITALHVWVHRGNPAGVFHPTNPTID